MHKTTDRLNDLSPAQRVALVRRLQEQRARRTVSTWSPLVPLQEGTASTPLFFVHPAGGALFWYLALLHELGAAYCAYGLQGHGLYGEQKPFYTIPEMAAAYVPLIQAQQPAGPCHLIGYSMGGVIAFEVAQQLQRQGRTVAQVILLDSYLYTERLPYPGREIVDPEERLVTRLMAALPAHEQRVILRKLRQLPNHRARIDFLYEGGRKIGRIPATYSLRDVARMYDAMDAHVDALAAYQAASYEGELTFFRCVDRSESEIAPYVPWATVARGVTEVSVPGKHSTLLEEPNVRTVARHLAGYLPPV